MFLPTMKRPWICCLAVVHLFEAEVKTAETVTLPVPFITIDVVVAAAVAEIPCRAPLSDLLIVKPFSVRVSVPSAKAVKFDVVVRRAFRAAVRFVFAWDALPPIRTSPTTAGPDERAVL